MKGVNIIAKTERGAAAIRQALADGKKASWPQRKGYEALWKEMVVCEDPFTARIEHRTTKLERVLKPSFLVPTLQEALAQNGATLADYEVVPDE